jgi:DNA-directed RNA polymerase specialized sigma24 family protein
MAAMAGLKPRALQILVMHYKLGYSDAHIAALLGTSRGVVAVTLYRIRRRLRTLLRSAGPEGDRI